MDCIVRINENLSIIFLNINIERSILIILLNLEKIQKLQYSLYIILIWFSSFSQLASPTKTHYQAKYCHEIKSSIFIVCQRNTEEL